MEELERDVGRLNRLLEGSRQEVRGIRERNHHLEATVKLLEERCEWLEKKCCSLLDYEAFQELFQILDPGPRSNNLRALVRAGSLKLGRPRQLGEHDELFLLM